MFIEGFPIWQQLIFYGIILSLFSMVVFVVIGMVTENIIVPYLKMIEDLKKEWNKSKGE